MTAKKVLIADDNPQLVQALTLRCRSLGLEVDGSPDGLHAWLNLIMPQPPDLVILDINMPFTDGLGVCKKISQDSVLGSIPIIILTGQSDPETIRQCQRTGAHYVLKGADTWERLEPLICRLLSLPYHPPKRAAPPAADAPPLLDEAPAPAGGPKVMIIDDDPAISRAILMELRPYAVQVLRAFTGEQGFYLALREKPDVIISDFVMPEAQGDYLLNRLQEHPLTKAIPVIVLTGKTMDGQKDFGLARKMMNLGAVEFLTKPPDMQTLFGVLRRYLPLSERPTGALADVGASGSG